MPRVPDAESHRKQATVPAPMPVESTRPFRCQAESADTLRGGMSSYLPVKQKTMPVSLFFPEPVQTTLISDSPNRSLDLLDHQSYLIRSLGMLFRVIVVAIAFVVFLQKSHAKGIGRKSGFELGKQ